MREYVVVDGCKEYAGAHQHINEGETIYCHAVGRFLVIEK